VKVRTKTTWIKYKTVTSAVTSEDKVMDVDRYKSEVEFIFLKFSTPYLFTAATNSDSIEKHNVPE